MNNTSIFYLIWLKFWFQRKSDKEIVFESSVLAWIRIRTRIEQKCWIRIRIKSIQIHNPDLFNPYTAFFVADDWNEGGQQRRPVQKPVQDSLQRTGPGLGQWTARTNDCGQAETRGGSMMELGSTWVPTAEIYYISWKSTVRKITGTEKRFSALKNFNRANENLNI
jgi:hypothetical protein